MGSTVDNPTETQAVSSPLSESHCLIHKETKHNGYVSTKMKAQALPLANRFDSLQALTDDSSIDS